MLFVAFVLALFVGLSLGLLGGGGSILTVPLFAYVLHVAGEAAIASSLFVVGATSLAGVAVHARHGDVRAGAGLLFGAAGMAGAFAGGLLGHRVPSGVLLSLFAVVMLVTSLAMMRRREKSGAGGRLAWPKALAIGAAVGAFSGLIGAGGGFLIVPALVLAGGLSMRSAVGTSLLVLALQSFAGFAGHMVAEAVVPWTLVAIVAAGSVTGGLAGARLGRRVAPAPLRRGFSWFLLAMAVFMLAKELSVAATARGLVTSEEPSCTSKRSTILLHRPLAT